MANFYGTEEGFTTYHSDRGRTVSSTWDIASALLVASEWLDSAYDQLWFGYATGGYTQERKWPRTSAMTNTFPCYVFTDSEIPEAVLHAAYEAAFREASSQGSLTVDFTPLKYKSAKVDGAVQVEYVIPNDASEIQTQMPVVGDLMQPLIDPTRSSSGSSGRLVRA